MTSPSDTPAQEAVDWRHGLMRVGGGILVLAVMASALGWMGRAWWCKCGELNLWAGDVQSSHCSQHLFDPYSFTHVLHGVMFYAILWLVAGPRLSVRVRVMIALCVEAAWEVFENTEYVIQRYRESTISLDYFGDSIVNSLGDVFACAIGCLVATSLPAWTTAAFFVTVEIALLFWIRDSLVLNILMLLFSNETIRTWQKGG